MVTDQVIVTAGAVFGVSARNGDIRPRTMEGLYAHDTRFLSSLRLSIEGWEPDPLGAGQFDHTIASFYATSHGVRNLPAGSLSIVRDRYVSHGLHEDITLVNYSSKPRFFRLTLTFDADFADVFEVRLGPVRKKGTVSVESRAGQDLALVYSRGEFRRETWISFSREPIVIGRSAVFDISLEPRATWQTCLSILPVLEVPPPPMPCVKEVLTSPLVPYQPAETFAEALVEDSQAPLRETPVLETDYDALRHSYYHALADLRSLRLEYEPGHYILAAGLPWYMAVFGRDSIISAIQTKLLGPELMVGTLHTLAGLQATERDDFRDAEPGKMPHEVRKGELSFLEQVPHSRYYGSVDATPLFITLLWEAFQWTGDVDMLSHFLGSAEAAMHWIDKYGDIDGDGLVEYQRRTRHGLRNQGWKDSWDSISFRTGELAEGPIALAEVQGYVYEAKLRMAEIYRILGNETQAQRLERGAERLRERFNDAFWMPEDGFFAVALDRRKRKVNSISSNPGHCLWSGIIDHDKAPSVVERLMAPDMFSGWGVRTLSQDMARYNPLSYHNGSVWPHDNSIIAAGLARYGFTREANQVIMAVLDAAENFADNRLPELFAGYPRRNKSFPVPYPAANIPQAWACGAVVYLLETLLGVVPTGDRLLLESQRTGIFISMSGVPYRGSRWVL